jgi:hypothetical protein
MPLALDRAGDFMLCNARLLERRLFEAEFGGGRANGVAEALAAYQNPDGGFGSGLEPDKRDPASQPVDLQIALETLDAVNLRPAAMLRAACVWMQGALAPEGGLPYARPSLNAFPHAPWWEVGEGAVRGNLNPTAAITGLLIRFGVSHPVLARAEAFCWSALEATSATDFHEVMPVLTFLENTRDRPRADAAIGAVRERVARPGVVALEPDAEGYVQKPLDFARSPSSPLHGLFAPDVLCRHLDALEARQQADGGWPLNWESVGVGAATEARGMMTLRALRTLKAYGRL